MRMMRIEGTQLLLIVGMTLGVATRAAAQAPSDPAGPPPVPPPDAVSGDPTASDNQSVSVPVPPPPPPETAQPEAPPPAAVSPQPSPPSEEEPQGFSRRGFYASIGIGTSIIKYQLDQRINDGLNFAGGFTELVPATLIKLGAGVGDQTAVHFTNRIAWLAHNDWAAVDHHERILTMSALTGLGITHFLDNTQRSWYVGGDLGVSQWLAFEEFTRDLRDVGVGLCAEVGYAFHESLSFEHSVCWGSVVSKRRDVDLGTEIDVEMGMPLTASFTVNWLK